VFEQFAQGSDTEDLKAGERLLATLGLFSLQFRIGRCPNPA
jgi:hypothetical protein